MVSYAEWLPSWDKLSSIPAGFARGRLCSGSPGSAVPFLCLRKTTGLTSIVAMVTQYTEEFVKDTVTHISLEFGLRIIFLSINLFCIGNCSLIFALGFLPLLDCVKAKPLICSPDLFKIQNMKGKILRNLNLPKEKIKLRCLTMENTSKATTKATHLIAHNKHTTQAPLPTYTWEGQWRIIFLLNS